MDMYREWRTKQDKLDEDKPVTKGELRKLLAEAHNDNKSSDPQLQKKERPKARFVPSGLDYDFNAHSLKMYEDNQQRKERMQQNLEKTLQSVNSKVAINIQRIAICKDNVPLYSQWCLYLGDGIFATTQHIFLGQAWDSVQISTSYFESKQSILIAKIPKKDLRMSNSKAGRDICLFTVSEYCPCTYATQNLMKNLVKSQSELDDIFNKCTKVYAMATDRPEANRRHKSYVTNMLPVQYYKEAPCHYQLSIDGQDTVIRRRDYFKVSGQITQRGDCSLPYFAICNNRVYIIGGHIAGKDDIGYGAPLVLDDFDVDSLRQPMEIVAHCEQMMKDPVMLSKPIPGHVPAPIVKKKHYYMATGPNQYEPSMLRKWMKANDVDLPDECKVMPTICQFRRGKDGELIDPMTKTNNKRAQTVPIPMPDHIRQYYVNDQWEHVFGGLVNELNVDARKAMINEPVWDPYKFLTYQYPLKPPVHSSSSGAIGIVDPRFKDKDKLYGRDIEPDAELLAKVRHVIAQARKGIDQEFIAPEALKRELMSIISVMEEHKCRTFNCGDLILNIALACTFGPIIYAVKKSAPECPLVYGYNPHSVDSKELFHKFQRPDGHILLEDLSSQDIFTQKWFALIFAWWVSVVSDVKRGSEDFNQFYYLARCCVNLYWLRGCQLYKTVSGHGSGTLITSIFNSFNRYVCNKLTFEAIYPDAKYEENVIAAVHGDDSLEHISSEFSEYTMPRKRDIFKDMFGFIVTAADKQSELKEHATIEDIEFLGRKPHIVDGLYCAKLKLSSITGMLNYTSNEISEVEGITANLRAAQTELVYHGREVFDSYKVIFDKFNRDHGCIFPVVTFDQEMHRLKYNWTRVQDFQI